MDSMGYTARVHVRDFKLRLTPLAFLDRITALLPPRRRYRYHVVLAPNSPLRQAVTARQPVTSGLFC